MSAPQPSVSSLRLSNRTGRALTLVVEPWATEYPFPHSATVDVVERSGSAEEAIEVELEADRVTVYARTAGTMSVFQNGVELLP